MKKQSGKAASFCMFSNSIFIIVLILFLSSCAGDNSNTEEQDSKESTSIVEIEDGVYLLKDMAHAKDELNIQSDNEYIIPYSHRFLDEKDTIEYYLIQRQPFVPLVLKSVPTLMGDKERLSELNVTLAPKYSQLLEEFTRENVDKMVCMVIGGEAVTRHKIREAIIGGRLKISRCTDHACEFLFTELKDNVH